MTTKTIQFGNAIIRFPSPSVLKFNVGSTYTTGDPGSRTDAERVFSYNVISRTAKTVTVTKQGRINRRGIHIADGVEFIFPEGRYSMAPVIKAG